MKAKQSKVISVGLFALVSVAIAACAPMQTGGAGQMSNGEPIAATLSADPMNGTYTFALISPEGWQCSGSVGNSPTPTAVRTVPLACTNGAKGNLVVTMNQFADQLAGSFKLSNGKSGQVRFGTTV